VARRRNAGRRIVCSARSGRLWRGAAGPDRRGRLEQSGRYRRSLSRLGRLWPMAAARRRGRARRFSPSGSRTPIWSPRPRTIANTIFWIPRLLSVHGRTGRHCAIPAGERAAALRISTRRGRKAPLSRPLSHENLPSGAWPGCQSEMDRGRDAPRLQRRVSKLPRRWIICSALPPRPTRYPTIISINCSLPIWKTSRVRDFMQKANPAALRENRGTLCRGRSGGGLWAPRSNRAADFDRRTLAKRAEGIA